MKKTLVALSLVAWLTSCGLGPPKITCGNADGTAVVKKLISDAAQSHALAQADGKAASVRAAQSRFQMEMSAFRTDKQDPDSSKVFCAAQLSYRLDPALMMALDQSAKALPSVGSLDTLAANHGFERSANVFVRQDFKYSLQPTDDGSMVFAESSDEQSATMLSDLILLDVVREASRSKTHVDVNSELARIQSEQAQVQQASAQLAAAQQALATQQQQTMPAVHPTVAPTGGFSPGFDCARATVHAERLICSDPALSALDVRLNTLYKDVLSSASDQQSARTAQSQWIERQRNTCTDVACLRAVYSARIEAFARTSPTTTSNIHPLLAEIPNPTPANADPGFAYVDSPDDGYLSLRTHPSVTQGQRLLQIPHGAEVIIFSCPMSTQDVVGRVSGTWCTAEYEGVRGFVFGPYLSNGE